MYVKFFLKLFLFLFIFVSKISCGIVLRPLTLDSVAELALSNYQMYHNNYDYKLYKEPQERALLNLQSAYIFKEGQPDINFFKKKCISVQENGLGDIGSVWLGLIANKEFSSTFSIVPQRRVFGAVFNYHHDMSTFIKGLWMSLFMPIVYVEHELNFEENLKSKNGIKKNFAGELLKNVGDAFNSKDWCFGKFCNKKRNAYERSACGLDDLQIKIGWNLFREEAEHLGLYFNLIIPFCDAPNPEFVFEPSIGNGGHVGVGCGTNTDLSLFDSKKSKINFLVDAKYVYLFSSCEKRSLDLKNGPLTRYLLVAQERSPSVGLDGINFFTHDLNVTPGGTVDIFTALHFAHSEFNFELGYDFWWREKEDVELKNSWDEAGGPNGLGIYDIVGARTGNPISASKATISSSDFGANKVVSDAKFTRIMQNDLDLDSAAFGSAATHKVFAGVSFNTKIIDNPALFGMGGAYEFSCFGSVFSNWEAWLRACISF